VAVTLVMVSRVCVTIPNVQKKLIEDWIMYVEEIHTAEKEAADYIFVESI
jgi:hypothetical protein